MSDAEHGSDLGGKGGNGKSPLVHTLMPLHVTHQLRQHPDEFFIGCRSPLRTSAPYQILGTIPASSARTTINVLSVRKGFVNIGTSTAAPYGHGNRSVGTLVRSQPAFVLNLLLIF
jgi:hypothetical protein